MAHIDPEMLHHGEDHGRGPTGPGSVSIFALLVLSIGAVGWIIEAAITGAVVRFISQVKPDLLGHVLHEKKTGE
jgi:hypothetical protein